MSLTVQSAIDATKPLHNESPAIDAEAPFRARQEPAWSGAKTRLGWLTSRPTSLVGRESTPGMA